VYGSTVTDRSSLDRPPQVLHLAKLDVIYCVLYAAKSTEDRHGSIPGQIQDCRYAIEHASDRMLAGEYFDEACSAYTGDRGPGLVDALRHAEELAREHGTAELWAQHSDRLARGDGRTARHAVEIALWALKREVRIRTIQDPDTFRDLLYAVVTGQRNHEDARRKGLASAAGYRRALQRGEYAGRKLDGYRLAVSIEDGKVVRRLEIDPDRRQAFELLFRLALKGKTSGAVARALNTAGWYTKPREIGRSPEPWNSSGVLQVLHNPRYAGLTASKGQIIGPAQWPPYISVRQHHRLQVLIDARWRRHRKRRFSEAFLLSRLVKCGRCGAPLHCQTAVLREDGTYSRRYLCCSHQRARHPGRCDAPRIDADVLEPMFVLAIGQLLPKEAEPTAPSEAEILCGHWTEAPERQQLRDAALAGDDERLNQSIERMAARVMPELAIHRRMAVSRRQTSREAFVRQLHAWAEARGQPPTDGRRQETLALNAELHEWFTGVHVQNTITETVIAAQPRPSALETRCPPTAEVRLHRGAWTRASRDAGRRARRPASWSNDEIVAALQDWALRHNRAPNSYEWVPGSPDRPSSICVRRRFGSWDKALKRAGLKPNTRRQGRYWTDEEIINALRTWARRHGRAPRSGDWTKATSAHPCARSVYIRYGTFGAAVAAALPDR
jgi:DNA invertase Pin-like site-specific DNA recombinase